MTAHPYSLRSRLSSAALISRTPTASPVVKTPSHSPRKHSLLPSVLQLKHISGTTTIAPSGLSCCDATNTFAYCAGSVAVLATIGSDGNISFRYFKAKPSAVAINAASYYDPISNNNTPTRRKSVFTPRRGFDDVKGGALGRELLDEASGQTWSARERIKAATCVSLSPDGKLLAIGETGYNPRVLVFSTALSASTDTPLSIMSEHTIGIRNVAFSPDSKYLATLGDVNDGFLYIWTISSKTGEVRLHSTNKCTTNICDMTWCGSMVVTVGTRHIKIWQVSEVLRTSPQKRARLRMEGEQVPSPGPIPLQGRNCLLGKMVDATFTAVVSVSPDKAVVCADDGHICILDLSAGNVTLSPVEMVDVPVAAITFRTDTHRVVWAGSNALQEQDLLCLMRNYEATRSPGKIALTKHQNRSSRHSLLRASLGLDCPRKARTVALDYLGTRAVSIDAGGCINILEADQIGTAGNTRILACHSDLVKGVQSLPMGTNLGSYFTWTRSGEVKFWNSEAEILQSRSCELDQSFDGDEIGTNELRVVRHTKSKGAFLTGDRYGVVRLVGQDVWSVYQTIRAHSAEITDIALHERSALVATCSRDRMVQLFQIEHQSMNLLQTLDDHISAVHCVIFNDNGNRLLSCSADRTIVVRERMERKTDGRTITVFSSAKVITLKASPLYMALLPKDPNLLVVSTMDKYIVRVDVSNGSLLDSFKVAERESDDTAVMNSFCLTTATSSNEMSLLAGYSSTDKSIRIYDLQKGVLLGRDSGHTEGISDVALIEDHSKDDSPSGRTLITTGLDGTVMSWNLTATAQSSLTPSYELSQAQLSLRAGSGETPSKPSPASLPPLRKVLSKIEMAEFTREMSPTRDASPNRLRRRPSKLALSTPIEEADELQSGGKPRARSRDRGLQVENRSPSPTDQPMIRPTKQRSKTDLGKGVDVKKFEWSRRSPSPPPTIASNPATPRHQRANNGRLRRPPSVPSDLRLQGSIQQRRQSAAQATDTGSMGAASESTYRMLKTYRKKLESTRAVLDLGDVERELEAILKLIQQRRADMITTKAEARAGLGPRSNVDNEVSGLSALLEKTTIG